MDFQLKYYFADHLTSLPKANIRELLASGDTSLPWDSLLFEQRKSMAIINYWGKIPATDASEYLKMNIRTAIANKDYKLANKAMHELYSLPYFSMFIFEELVFNAMMQQPELMQNAAALLSKAYLYDLAKTTEFINHWISKRESLSNDMALNLLHLNTLVSHSLLSIWDLPSKRLSNVIHPKNLLELWTNTDTENHQLILNLHLTFIQYFGQINDTKEINSSFDYITRYFQANADNLEDEVALVLFFNHWSRYDITIEYLSQRFVDGELNDEGIFILLQTLSFYRREDNQDLFEELNRKAFELNTNRWCDWVHAGFQLLRLPEVKGLYCGSCSSGHE